MKKILLVFCLIASMLFSTSYIAFANNSDEIIYNINIYINDSLEKTIERSVVEGESIEVYDFGEFIKGNATINGAKAQFLCYDNLFSIYTTSWGCPTAEDNVVVNLYYKVEKEPEPEPEPTYGTVTLNISDGKNPVEGYSVTFNGEKGYKEDSVTGISTSEGKIIVQLDESYSWEYSVDGSTWNVDFENHAYRNDISLQKELEPVDIEYDGQDYNVNVKLQFNEEAGGTLTDGLSDSTDIIEKNFTKTSGTAITYQEIVEEFEKQDELIIHNEKLYRSSSTYVSAKDSVYTENSLVNHGEYVVTNANTTIIIQFIYVKDLEPAVDPTPEPTPAPGTDPEPDPVVPDTPDTPDTPDIIKPVNPDNPTNPIDTETPKKTEKKSEKTGEITSVPKAQELVTQRPLTITLERTEYITEYVPVDNDKPATKNKVIEQTITPTKAPLSAPIGKWALINLIAMLVTVILAISLIATLIYHKLNEDDCDEEDEEDEEVKYKTPLRILSIIIAIITFIIFILTENIFLPMALVDKYTLSMIIILIVQIIITILSKRKIEEYEYEE